MLLEEQGWFDRAPIEVHGSDASPAAIGRANDGLYRERSFRTLPPAMKDKYFVPSGSGWRVSPVLTRRVRSWSVVNLMAADVQSSLAGSPVIFCRNAFIYFAPSAIKKVTDIFSASMPSPGYLCVGASESLLNITSAFMLQEIGGAFVYAKR